MISTQIYHGVNRLNEGVTTKLLSETSIKHINKSSVIEFFGWIKSLAGHRQRRTPNSNLKKSTKPRIFNLVTESTITQEL